MKIIMRKLRGSNRNGNTLQKELPFIQGDEVELGKNAFQNKYKAKIKVHRPRHKT